ncbi:peptidoglycan -binding protein [Celeribacter halophilus]|uniref:Peptidoglycan -binding protein n=1 Tax=Celeribacter halophilus TaxID=576117 RepID=A0AAW7XRZ5_9RHOB|nr:peptidoglycan -binding protein [Celeribacter halophilus]MDO6457181.1 peptidoglycan -binding protein [Celeribacter halophilus]MDO6723729.1 peptidoglycan -binding protein [Celeribacter halophilus]
MAVLRRASHRMSGSIWPGFVDAMTALLLVLMFVLTIFMVVQSMLRDQISGQEHELDALSAELNVLADALGLEQQKNLGLETQIGALNATLSELRATAEAQSETIAGLEAENTALTGRIASFEQQVASLIAERDAALTEGAQLAAQIDDLEAAKAQLITEQEAAQLALAKARDEIDAATEEARLAAARREALEALVTQLRAESEDRQTALDAAQAELSQAEQDRLADAAALQALKERFANADEELTAMSLALEEARKEAEETLTLLAAARTARDEMQAQLDQDISEREKQAALLATAQAALAEEEAKSAEGERKLALLNAQVEQMRNQLSALQSTLDVRTARDAENQVQIDSLTQRLNTALAQVAAEERARAALEEAERKRLEEEAKTLQNYRSEFFGRMREILGNREGVRIVGDRFVFSSEVLFESASADLNDEGKAQIARVAAILSEVSSEIPPEIDWVIRVDGHTDKTPLSGSGAYRDNWELSQARALSVVRYMSEVLGFDPSRLVAAGFGEYQPVAEGDSPEALAQNRRIELKLTEK